MRKLLTLLFTMCCAISFAQLDNAQLGMSIKGSQTLPGTITVTSSETLAVGDPVFIDVTIDSTNRTAEPGLDANNGVVAISNDGSRIIYGLGITLYYYNYNGTQYQTALTLLNTQAKSVAISSDGSIFAANSLTAENTLLYHRNGLTYVLSLYQVVPSASAPLALTADGNRLLYATNASGTAGLSMFVWTGSGIWFGNDPDTDYDQITTMSVTPDGEYLVCGRSVAPYLVTYKWDAVDARYELMTAPDTVASYFVQSVTLSDDGQTLYVAQATSSANYYKIHRYDYSSTNGRYELTKTTPLNFGYLTKIKAIGHGRWLFALYRSGGTSYTIREVNGETLTFDTTSKTMVDTGTNAIYDFDLATNENDYAYYTSASYYRLSAAEVYPKFTAVKANTIIDTAYSTNGTFQQSCGYITDSTKQFGASAKILLSDPSLAPYLE